MALNNSKSTFKQPERHHGNNTALIGGVIASTQAAIDNNKNSFTTGGTLTTSDIQNSASFNGSAFGISVDAGKQPNKPGTAGVGIGIGSDKGEASSVTTAGISGIAGNTAVRTGDAETGLKPIFDATKVQAEINAQVQIMQAFTKEAPKAVASYADEKLKAAVASGDQAEIDKWKEGGAARVALHTLTGALTGGLGGAVGAAASQTLVPLLGEEIAKLDIPLEIKQALIAAAGTAIGAAVGGSAGAAMGLAITSNNYLTHTDIRSRDQKLKLCQANGDTACEVRVLKEYDLLSASRTGAINYNSILSESSLQAEKVQLEQLLSDPKLSAESKAQAQRSINELNFAINIIQRSPVLRDAEQLGLVVADIALLGEMATAKALTSAVVQRFILARTGKEITGDAAAALANNFYRDGVNPPNWTPGKIQDIALNSVEHWTKHGAEFPNLKSANDYVEAANKFITNPPPGTQSYTRLNGDKIFYDSASNTFAVQASNGMPRTMFKPDGGDLYWLKQTGFLK